MFRDYEIRYLATSVLVAWILTIALAAYEIFANRTDTVPETGVAVYMGAAASTGVTLLVVATVEVFMVLYRRINERLLADARQEGEEKERERLQGERDRLQAERDRLREWYYSLPRDVRDQLPPPRGE